jgi:vitamin B12 transporter
MAGWDVVANVTLQNPKNAAGTNAGKLLQRRPKQIANLDVDRKLADVRVGASIHVESERYDDVANASAKKLPGYGTRFGSAEYCFRALWNTLVKDHTAWDQNPWVWVIEFKRVEI